MSATQELPNLMTVREVATCLRLSPSTVCRRVEDGTIAAVRIGGAIRIPSAEVARILQEAQARMVEVRERQAERRLAEVHERHPRRPA